MRLPNAIDPNEYVEARLNAPHATFVAPGPE